MATRERVANGPAARSTGGAAVGAALGTTGMVVPAQTAWPAPASGVTNPAWDWYAAQSRHRGLEVTEHEVPVGWFEQTFGTKVDRRP